MATITDIFTGGYRFLIILQSTADNKNLKKGDFKNIRIEGVQLTYYPSS